MVNEMISTGCCLQQIHMRDLECFSACHDCASLLRALSAFALEVATKIHCLLSVLVVRLSSLAQKPFHMSKRPPVAPPFSAIFCCPRHVQLADVHNIFAEGWSQLAFRRFGMH